MSATFGQQQVYTIQDVPASWILTTYLGLGHLTGETVRMKSPFAPNSSHLDPLCIYFNQDAQEYRFKCWSSGRGGRLVDLLMQIWGKSFPETAATIEGAYQKFLASGHSPQAQQEFLQHRWKVVHWKTRGWTKDDAGFWPSYNISSDLLTQDLVVPLQEYSMLKFINGEETDQGFAVVDRMIYGYFTPQGELYKIYQPMNRERKYLKVGDYLQGEHSLQGHPYLCISSGMKDMLALKSLGLRVDFVAPDSENNLLSYEELVALRLKHDYRAVLSLLDIDTTGLQSMRDYHAFYGVPYCYLKAEKDAALSIKRLGAQEVRQRLVPSLHRAVENFHGLHPKPTT